MNHLANDTRQAPLDPPESPESDELHAEGVRVADAHIEAARAALARAQAAYSEAVGVDCERIWNAAWELRELQQEIEG